MNDTPITTLKEKQEGDNVKVYMHYYKGCILNHNHNHHNRENCKVKDVIILYDKPTPYRSNLYNILMDVFDEHQYDTELVLLEEPKTFLDQQNFLFLENKYNTYFFMDKFPTIDETVKRENLRKIRRLRKKNKKRQLQLQRQKARNDNV